MKFIEALTLEMSQKYSMCWILLVFSTSFWQEMSVNFDMPCLDIVHFLQHICTQNTSWSYHTFPLIQRYLVFFLKCIFHCPREISAVSLSCLLNFHFSEVQWVARIFTMIPLSILFYFFPTFVLSLGFFIFVSGHLWFQFYPQLQLKSFGTVHYSMALLRRPCYI